MMNQLAFSSKQQLQEQNPLRVSSDSSRQWSPQASPTNQQNSSNRHTKQQQQQRKTHVQFTLQNVPPSPLHYQHQTNQQANSSSARNEDVENDKRGFTINGQQLRRPWKPGELGPASVSQTAESATNTTRKTNTTKAKELTRLPDRKSVKKKPTAPRKPAWDADVQHTSSFFDTSIKKSTLFQPKLGDRRQESEKETQQIRDRLSSLSKSKQTPSANFQRLSLNTKSNSLRNVKSTISTTSALRLPPRPTKDFLRLNFERITGRPYDHQNTQKYRPTLASSRSNVFERLSKPQIIPKSLLRSVHFSDGLSPKHANPDAAPITAEHSSKDVALSPLSPRRLQESESSPRLMIHVNSPVVNSSPNQEQSPRSSVYSSPRASQQQRQSSSRSRSPKSTRGPSSRTAHQSYGASVFAVLDRQQRGQIGVSQILEGLRLLRLPATHNQISDYVYLIHEGDRNTISLEEWEILVGTLDAASQPSSASPLRSEHNQQASALSLSSSRSRDRVSVRSNRANDTPRSYRLSPSARSEQARQFADPPEPQCDQEYTSFPRPAIGEGDYLIEEIQRRVDEMFQRAEDTARLRYQNEPNCNQQERGRGDSDQVLRQAASVVYSLKASLFPLVNQAEALLRGIHKGHQGAKLSLLLPQEGLNTIARHSDDLAAAILDDILLDTAFLLNDEEKRTSEYQMELCHADQLDAILDQITRIEDQEDHLIQQGLALGYSTSNQLGFGRVSQTKQSGEAIVSKSGVNAESMRPVHNGGVPLVLPLEVVMNIDIPVDTEQNPSGFSSSNKFENGIVSAEHVGNDSTSSPTRIGGNRKVSASILYGHRYLAIEKRRQQFQHHRRLVESSLAGTGMDQCAVIEVLEEMLLDDLLADTTAELDASVTSLADTLVTTLI